MLRIYNGCVGVCRVMAPALLRVRRDQGEEGENLLSTVETATKEPHWSYAKQKAHDLVKHLTTEPTDLGK